MEIPAGYFRIGVVGVVLRDNRILLGKRLKQDEAYGKWVFPGGRLEGDESFEEALKREIKEEVGLDVTPGELITATRSSHSGKKNVALIYWAYANGQEGPQSTEEIGDPTFFTIRQILALGEDSLMPATVIVLKQITHELV